MSDDIHDTSRIDGYLRARQKVALLNASWRPMLAGAIGASLIIAAVWVATPKFTIRDVVVDHVVQKDVSVDHVITHDVPIDIPRIVTPEERRFLNSPGYAGAPMHGRIVPSRSERALSFDDGSDYTPTLPGMAADAAPYVGLWGYCSPTAANKKIFHCFALRRDGAVVSIPQKPLGRPA